MESLGVGRDDLPAWVREAEDATKAAHDAVLAAHNAYLVKKAEYEHVACVAANRRGVRDKRNYTPFPGVGVDL